MRKVMMMLTLPALALAACTPTGGGVASNGGVAAVSDPIALKSTTALSLAELAFNSAEEAATAAIKSGHLSKAQVEQLGVDVHKARDYRDQARALVSAGGDASSVIESLNTALAAIHTLAGQ